ncbi:hypothetical protein IL306_000098 [Fusarium sp. DS 682]|nr:hypothetical protein IL306_000098 [Fusarium sp. DS 682]
MVIRVRIHGPGEKGEGPNIGSPHAAHFFTPFEDEKVVTEIWVSITQNLIGGLGDFFGGSIDLAGVVEVTFYRLQHKPEIILGMLFRFTGGRREALRGVRLNGLQEPVLLEGEGREFMYLEFGYDSTGVAPGHPNLLNARFTGFEELSEDIYPASHSDIVGHRLLVVS